MKISYVDPHGFIEGTAYSGDAGVDLRACSDPLIMGHRLRNNEWKHIDYIEYDTGIKIEPSTDKITSLLFPRSSISRYNLSLCNSVGVIDGGYRDTIKVRFNYIAQPSDYFIFEKWLILVPALDRIYQRGDKIAQLVFSTHPQPEWVKVEKLTESERNTGGFGSSGS